MWMNSMEIDEALDIVRAHAPAYLPYVKYLGDWRDIINQNSDGWAYWRGGTRPAEKLMNLVHQLVEAVRSGRAEPPSASQFEKALTPIKAAATRHKLPAPTFQGRAAGKAAPSREQQILALARNDPKLREGELELDDSGAKVSEGDANGAYVQVWMWVPFAGTALDKEA